MELIVYLKPFKLILSLPFYDNLQVRKMLFETLLLITVESTDLKDIREVARSLYRKGFRISDFELEVETTIKSQKREI